MTTHDSSSHGDAITDVLQLYHGLLKISSITDDWAKIVRVRLGLTDHSNEIQYMSAVTGPR